MENGEDDPPFDFRSEVEPKTSNPKSKAPSINKSKLNTYGVTNIELENKKLTSVKSITDKSYETNDTPKSQVTIVPRKMSKTDRMISRPPLQRKANEVTKRFLVLCKPFPIFFRIMILISAWIILALMTPTLSEKSLAKMDLLKRNCIKKM